MPLAEQRGGSEIMLRQLVEHTPPELARWQVVFLRDGPMVRELAELGARVEVVDAGRLREPHRHGAVAARIAGIAHRGRADVIVGWMVKSQLYAGPAGLLSGKPVVWYQLGTPSPTAWLERAATALPARGIIAVSAATAAAQARMRPRRAVRVVHPGVELDRFDPARMPSPAAARGALGLPAEGPLIGIVGRLQRWKGTHVLIEAMPGILRAHPGAHCVVVGGTHDLEPDYPAFVEDRIAVLGLQDAVTLAGLQSDIPIWMQAMDVVVHASDREPLGIVILEAMALGKPVVAGNAGGPLEIISDGVDGVLAPYGDAPALAAAVLRYLDDPRFASTVGRAGRKHAASFGVERFAREIVSAVAELAQSPSR